MANLGVEVHVRDDLCLVPYHQLLLTQLSHFRHQETYFFTAEVVLKILGKHIIVMTFLFNLNTYFLQLNVFNIIIITDRVVIVELIS